MLLIRRSLEASGRLRREWYLSSMDMFDKYIDTVILKASKLPHSISTVKKCYTFEVGKMPGIGLVPYHLNSTSSEQNPGPMAASKPYVPGSGRRCMKSCNTSSTDVEERLPTRRRQSQDTSRAFRGSLSALAVASRMRGPPVCSTQHPMSSCVTPQSVRNASTS